jgi:hypothetical protein
MAEVLAGPPHKVFLLNFGAIVKARPAFTPVAPNDKVKFVNRAGGAAHLQFTGGVFNVANLTVDDGQSQIVTVQSVNDGRYSWSGTVNGIPVDGESSPEIIVDR